MLLIGTSLSRCLHSIARNEVDVGDILFIVTSTRAEDYPAFVHVVDQYMDLTGYDEATITKVKLVASYLYKSGRIHQPRVFNDAPANVSAIPDITQDEVASIGPNVSLSPLEQPEISKSTAWIQVVPTNQNTTPAVVAAYEHYKVLDSLTK